MFSITDTIDIYLDVFKEISTLYMDKSVTELVISEKISELVKKLKKFHNSEAIDSAIEKVISVLESYVFDEYNTIDTNIEKLNPNEHSILTEILEKELTGEEIEVSFTELSKLSKTDKSKIIEILKKELS